MQFDLGSGDMRPDQIRCQGGHRARVAVRIGRRRGDQGQRKVDHPTYPVAKPPGVRLNVAQGAPPRSGSTASAASR